MGVTGSVLIFVGGVIAAAVVSWLFRRSERWPLAVGAGLLIVLLSHYPLARVYGGTLSFITYAVWVTAVAAAFTLGYAKLRGKR
ncbi:MAG TPA: hypothetical protein VF570_07460 [Pyrinomonadaceae bacterium]|jgi:hypothetical protein